MEYLSVLERKDVINIFTGARLGTISDVVIDLNSGRICSVVISTKKGLSSFFCEDKCFEFGWECIRKIGNDTILVEINEKKTEKDCF